MGEWGAQFETEPTRWVFPYFALNRVSCFMPRHNQYVTYSCLHLVTLMSGGLLRCTNQNVRLFISTNLYVSLNVDLFYMGTYFGEPFALPVTRPMLLTGKREVTLDRCARSKASKHI